MNVANKNKQNKGAESLQRKLKRNLFQLNRNLLLRSQHIQPFIIYVALSI